MSMAPIYWHLGFALAALAVFSLDDKPPSQLPFNHWRIRAAMILLLIAVVGAAAIACFGGQP